MTAEVLGVEDPRDRRLALGSTGIVSEHNRGGVLEAADVHVADRLGVLAGEDDPDVLLAVALTVRAVRSGSVCVDLSSVAGIGPGLRWPGAGWRAKVAASPVVSGGALRLEGDLLYLDRYWGEERQVVEDLRRRSAAGPPAVDSQVLDGALDRFFPGSAYADQRAAAEMACRRWTSVVTGGPGTGKTTTVARLLGVLLAVHAATPGVGDRPLRVALAAPTGKAAARMLEAVRDATASTDFPDRRAAATIQALSSATLHRLLGWRPDSGTRFRHDRHHRLPHDVVVVDESSMVSLTLMARLVEAVRPEARLVLVGDPDQLASVDAGAVLKDLVDGYSGQSTSPVVRLERTRRFGAEIGALADAVREGDVAEALSLLTAGSSAVRWTPEEDLPAIIGAHALRLRATAETGEAAAVLQALDAHRLLCAHREGPFGVAHWNVTVERLLLEPSGQDWLAEWYPGRPVVVNANDYGLRLWNGDTGVAVPAAEGGPGLDVLLGDGSAVRRLPTGRLADVTTAHAMTVHRSQGSQFDEVTVLLPEAESRILTRELLYTAVTRARHVVWVVGSEESIRAAVERQAQRATGLSRRLVAP